MGSRSAEGARGSAEGGRVVSEGNAAWQALADDDDDFIEIEKHVPIPRIKGHRYPWKELEVDDSFFVSSGDLKRTMDSLSSCRNQAQIRYGRRYTLRKEDGGVRVWRTR